MFEILCCVLNFINMIELRKLSGLGYVENKRFMHVLQTMKHVLAKRNFPFYIPSCVIFTNILHNNEKSYQQFLLPV